MNTNSTKGHILIVEDEFFIYDELHTFFTSEGFTTSDYITNYADAMESVKLVLPDLALIDIGLDNKKSPEDGVILARDLKDRYQIPCLFLTGQRDLNTLAKVRSIEESHLILKTTPIDKDQLLVSVLLLLREGRPNKKPSEISAKGKDLFVQHEGNTYIIPCNKIRYIETTDIPNTVKIVLSEGIMVEVNPDKRKAGSPQFVNESAFFQNTSLAKLEADLPDYFKRSYQDCLINALLITGLSGTHVFLGNQAFNLSRESRTKLIKYLRERDH